MLTVVCALLLTAKKASGQAGNSADLYKRILPSVITLSVEKPDGKYSGTAFLIDGKGVAATAWHVISKATSARAKFSDGEEFDVSGVIDKDEKRDVALIKVKVAGRPTLEVSTSEPAVGTKAFVIGSPEGLDFSITEGLISQIRMLDTKRVIQFSCPASPGNSGGPLVDADGKVLGVVSFQYVEGQNLNFAIPGAVVGGLDATLPTQPWSSVKPSPDSKSEHLFDVNRWGAPEWDGTWPDGSNPWRALLVYYENSPVTALNVMLGFVAFDNNTRRRVDARGISILQANRLCKYLQEFLDTNRVSDAPHGKLTLPTIRFASNDVLFTDKPLEVLFVRGEPTAFSKAKWEVKFLFDRGNSARFGRAEVRSFLEAFNLWKRMLKEDGLDLDASSPATSGS